jgi:N-acetyl sugar amidotransferase
MNEVKRIKTRQICRVCLMDTSDPGIRFDASGKCDYCINFEQNLRPRWEADVADPSRIQAVADSIRTERKGQDFDCIIGLSGGLDSSYTAFVAKEVMGLRPLLFHVDAGWNTDQAVGNIERLVNGLELDLYTEVIDWEEMKDLQVAFLKSQIADQDIPQDAAFFSALYLFARKHRIKHVLTGSNYSTECCREPEEWGGYPGIDKRLILDIHSRFGNQPLKSFPLVDIFVYKVLYQRVLGMEVVKPLNLVPYVKREAERTLESRFGWKKFRHKHHESRFTRFYEDYWMPEKFGYHKRRAHFSSLIMTGQMEREEALDRLARPEMDEHFLTREFEYVANKLDLSVGELRSIFEGQNRTYRDYRNKRSLIGLGANMMQRLGMERRLFR